ncbi:MAG TPA: lamin tail domain-containing protein [Planctomycetota bacterium]|nr:lamin tail domain-containing protein [Planctomycetota bacterium]
MKHAAFAALTLCLFLGRSVSGSPVVDPAAPVFINEFHYDNDGTDTGEAIEIAGPAGTDLAGWKLVLYNGANGAVYNTLALTGLILDQLGGFGTLSFSYPVNGIQNGSPDGIALVKPDNSVVEFLSYEGVFTGVGGPPATRPPPSRSSPAPSFRSARAASTRPIPRS